MLNNINDLLLVAGKQESGYEPYYEVLEKITLTGAEYFDLGYKVSDFAIGDTIRFEGIVKGTDADTISSSGSQLMFSIGNDGGQWLGKAQNGTKYAFGTPNQSTIDFNEEVLADVTITISGNANKPTFTITGSVTSDTETSTIPQRSATPAYYDFPLLFGAGTRVTGEKAYGGDYTIKCGKIYINGTMTKDYVPALDSQMRPCLYDKISKTFTYAKKLSDGTDATDTLTFKRWNKFEVDYIESDGNQYINTEYNINENTVIKFKAKSTDATQWNNTLTGCGTNSSSTDRVQCHLGTGSAGSGGKVTIRIDGTMSSASTAPTIDDKWFAGEINIPDKKAYINDTEVISNFSGSYIKTIPVAIFGRMVSDLSTQGYGIDAGYLAKACLAEYQFIENNVVVRNFKPVVWHNGDTTAEACLYDEVYNKMYPNAGTGNLKAYIINDINYTLMSYTYMNTHGYYISATGAITAQAESDYTDAIAVEQGDIVTLTTSTTSRVSNKRIHGYNGTSTSDWVSQLGVIEYAQTGRDTRTLSVVVPSGVSYIRISHSIYGETQCDLTITRTYEVGKSVSGTPSSSILGVSNCFDTALYGTQDTTVKYFAIGYDSNTTAGQLFGSYDGNTETSNNLTINSTGTGNTAPIRFDGQVITTAIKIPINTFASIITSKYGLWVNDTLHGTWGDVNDFTTTTTMLILKCNNSTNTRNNGCGYCLILEKDVPTAEYIPVRNANNTSVYGLYDRISKTLNTGVGTINFNVLD